MAIRELPRMREQMTTRELVELGYVHAKRADERSAEVYVLLGKLMAEVAGLRRDVVAHRAQLDSQSTEIAQVRKEVRMKVSIPTVAVSVALIAAVTVLEILKVPVPSALSAGVGIAIAAMFPAMLQKKKELAE